MKKTKIVATIGPVSDSKETLRTLIESGMNVARLNFSHGEHEWHKKIILTIRELSAEMQLPVAILGDLQGPRIRTVMPEPLEMNSGEEVLVTDVFYHEEGIDISADTKVLVLDAPKIINDIDTDHAILIEDGLMKLVVTRREANYLVTKVIDGGTVKNRKGVNIPDSVLSISTVTPKDELDLAFLVENEVDFIALSFVGSASDVTYLKGRIKELAGRDTFLPHVVVKIERKEAIKNLDEIIAATDAVMVARGDLGIEIEGTKVAILQKQIVKKSIELRKPVIVATQMLDSMIVNPRPTRAEISDVTNAVFDHVDAVMLSGESAGGKYPVESVRTMRNIIMHAEEAQSDATTYSFAADETSFLTLVKSATDMALNHNLQALVLPSVSGYSARMVAHFRANKPTYVATNHDKTYQQLALVWGIQSYLSTATDMRELVAAMIEHHKNTAQLHTGDTVIAIFGQPNEATDNMQMVGVKTI